MNKTLFALAMLIIAGLLMSCGDDKDKSKKDKKEPVKKEKVTEFKWTDSPMVKDIPDANISGKIKGVKIENAYVQFNEEKDEVRVIVSKVKPDKLCGKIGTFVKGEQMQLVFEKKFEKGKTYTKILKDAPKGTLYYFEEKDGKQQRKSEYLKIAYAIEITELSGTKVKGKIAFCGDDSARSYVAGTFDGEYCPTRYKVIEKPHKVNGVLWQKEKYDAKDIPDKPIEGMFIGSKMDIKDVEVKIKKEGYSIIIRNKKPNEPCKYASEADSFKIDSKKPLKKGTFIATSLDKGVRDKWHTWFSYPQNHDRGPMSYNTGWTLALKIDKIDEAKKIVEGKVIVACTDEAKTMIAGAFKANLCDKK